MITNFNLYDFNKVKATEVEQNDVIRLNYVILRKIT